MYTQIFAVDYADKWDAAPSSYVSVAAFDSHPVSISLHTVCLCVCKRLFHNCFSIWFFFSDKREHSVFEFSVYDCVVCVDTVITIPKQQTINGRRKNKLKKNRRRRRRVGRENSILKNWKFRSIYCSRISALLQTTHAYTNKLSQRKTTKIFFD